MTDARFAGMDASQWALYVTPSRTYDPPLYRWMSPDQPLVDQYEEDPQSWNLYAYVRNNPLRFSDPSGEACVVDPSTGKEHDDESGGQTCAEAHSPEQNNRPSVTVFGQAEAMTWRQRLLLDPQLNEALNQQMLIDLKAGRLTITKGEVPIGPGEAAAIWRAGIKITQAGLRHVLARHAVGGTETWGKSLFNAGEDIVGLIKAAESTGPTAQAGGNLARVVDAGRTIGTDRATGAATSTYTVITRPNGDLVTAFPGHP